MNQRLPIFLLPLSALSHAQSPFLEPVELTLNMNAAVTLATDDFSGDGIADVVVGGDGLYLVRSRGAAGFAGPQRIHPASLDVRAMAAGDLSGDGHLDLLTVEIGVGLGMPDPDPFQLVAYENDGAGSFTRRVLLDIGPESLHVQLEDIDGDGDADFILDQRFLGDTVWYENVQGSIVGPSTSISTTLSASSRVEDANQDGLADLIFEDVDGADVVVIPATAPGVFGPSLSLFTATGAGGNRSALLRDVDGDGILDGIITDNFSLSVLYATAPLSFLPPTVLSLGGSSRAPMVSFVGDLNGDGLNDIGYSDLLPPFSTRARWIAAQPGGGFSAPQAAFLPLAFFPGDQLKDVTGDGLVDAIDLNDAGFTWYPNDSMSTGPLFGAGAGDVLIQTPDLNGVAVLDIDSDGDVDIVGLRRDNTTLGVLENDGSGSFLPSDVILFSGDRAESVCAHDFDQDGDDDLLLVAGNAGSDSLQLLRNDGGGSFQQLAIFSPQAAGIGDPQVGDVDGDGDLDITVSSGDGQAALRWLRNDGSNSFTEILIGMPVGTTLGDVDDDGLLDFACVRSAPATQTFSVTWRKNLGGGSFAPEAFLLNAFNNSYVSLGDVNSDGKTDIILNQGNPIFVAEAVTAGSQYGLLTSLGIFFANPSQRLLSLDLNADGREDLVGSRDFMYARVWINPGAGGMAGAVQIFPGFGAARTPSFADLDGDGDLDAVGDGGGPITVAFNGTSRPVGTNVCGPANPTSIGIPARMAADGSLDLADMDLTLIAEDMPSNVTGIFLVSRTVGAPRPLVGSQGTLCLTGAVGRFSLPMEIMNSGADGSMRLALDVNFIPQGNGRIPLMPGETWHFQGWFRDNIFPTGPTSNLTDAIALTF